MEADRSSAPSSKPATTHSCQRCAVRKIRCDKQQPCAACVKADARCEPRVVRPPRRKRGLNRNEILSGRLAQYEKLLQQKDVGPVGLTRTPGHNASSLTTNGTVSTTKERSPSQAPDVPPAQPLGVGSRPQLLHDKGRSKYIDKFVYHNARTYAWLTIIQWSVDKIGRRGESTIEVALAFNHYLVSDRYLYI